MTIISNNGNTVTINGQTFKGNSVSIINGQVIVDGVKQGEKIQEYNISVSVTGDVNSVTTSSGDVTVNGKVSSIKTQSGDVDVTGDAVTATTMSGDIDIGGACQSASSMSGGIKHRKS